MKTTLVLAALLAAAPLAASAAPLSYTFVEGGYSKVHVDANDLDSAEADGAYLRGSYDLGGGIYALASVARVSDSEDLGGGYRLDVDLTGQELGLGYHQSMSDRVDFIAELAWVREKIDAEIPGVDSVSDQATGGRGAVGLRGAFTENLEGLLKANYYDGNDFDGTWTATVGAEYRFTPTWGVSAEVEHGDLIDDESTTRYTIGVRASF